MVPLLYSLSGSQTRSPTRKMRKVAKNTCCFFPIWQKPGYIWSQRSSTVKKSLWVLVIAALVTLSSCLPGDGKHTAEKQAGFFWGVWHGWVAPISLVGKLFSPNLRVYEPNNTGWWYDFGFYLAIVGGFGGLSLARGRKRHNNS